MNKRGNGRFILLIFLVVTGYSLCMNIVGTTLDPIVDSFALSGAGTGLINSMISLGGVLPLLVLPLLQGRVHKAVMICLSAALQILTMFLVGVSNALGVLLTSFLLFGTGNGFTDSCVNSYILDLYPEDNSRYLNLMHGVYGVGGLLAPLLAMELLTLTKSWRAVYGVVGAAVLALCLPFAFAGLRRAQRESGARHTDEKLTAEMAKAYFAKRGDRLILIAAMFGASAQLGLTAWAARYTELRFADAHAGSVCISVYWVFCALSRMLGGRLRLRAEHVLVYGCIGAGIANALGVLAGSAEAMIVASGFIGLLSGQCIPLFVSEAAIGNAKITALTTSCVFLCMNAIKVFVPLLLGAVDSTSLVAAMLLPALFHLLCALFCFFGCRLKHAGT